MRMSELEKMGDNVKAMNPKLFGGEAVAVADEKTKQVIEERFSKATIKAEKELQKICESWLVLNGYKRRTPDDITAAMPQQKYFIHLNETKKNPILLDLLLMGGDGRYMEIELKTRTGRLSIEQTSIILNNDYSAMVRDFDSFKKAVLIWEQAGRHQQEEKEKGAMQCQ